MIAEILRVHLLFQACRILRNKGLIEDTYPIVRLLCHNPHTPLVSLKGVDNNYLIVAKT